MNKWISWLLAFGCSCAVAREIAFEEKRLAVVPEDLSVNAFTFRPDGKSVAYQAHVKGGWCIVDDGVRSETFVSGPWPNRSPGGRTVWYTGVREGKRFLFVNGKEQGREYDFIGVVRFSPDGSTMAYSAGVGNEYFYVLNGVPGEKFEGVQSIQFSPDGNRLNYMVRKGGRRKIVTGTKSGGEWSFSRSTWAGEDFEVIYYPLFGYQDSPVAYGGRKGQKMFLVVKGKTIECENVDSVSPTPDGRTVAYGMKRGDTWQAFVGDEEIGGEFDEAGGPSFSPDGRTLAYWARENDKKFVVVGDRKGEEFDDVEPPVWSPSGRTVAYVAERGEKQLVVVGDRKGREFDTVFGPRFPTGRDDVVYVGKEGGKDIFVVGDFESQPFEHLPVTAHINLIFDEQSMVFSADGSGFAYRAEHDGRYVVVLGDKMGEHFDDATRVAISPDGRSVAYWAKEGDKEYVVVNEERGEGFEKAGRPCFSPDGRQVGFGVLQSGELWWKVVDIP